MRTLRGNSAFELKGGTIFAFRLSARQLGRAWRNRRAFPAMGSKGTLA